MSLTLCDEICTVQVMQAGAMSIPEDVVMLMASGPDLSWGQCNAMSISPIASWNERLEHASEVLGV